MAAYYEARALGLAANDSSHVARELVENAVNVKSEREDAGDCLVRQRSRAMSPPTAMRGRARRLRFFSYVVKRFILPPSGAPLAFAPVGKSS